MTSQDLMNQVHGAIQLQGLSTKTETSYLDWIYRYSFYNSKRNPAEMGASEVTTFLNYLATDCKKSPSTINQALSALVFLYKQVLKQPLQRKENLKKIHQKQKLPLILTRTEIKNLLNHLDGEYYLLASLMYGSGLRLCELLQLRIRDIDLRQYQLSVWQPEIQTYRKTVVPITLDFYLKEQLERVQQLHRRDIEQGLGETVTLWGQSNEEKPQLSQALCWQFLFPSSNLTHVDSVNRSVRLHRHVSTFQKALKEAVLQAGLPEETSCQTLRHSFALHMLESGCDPSQLRKILGHRNIRSTLLYKRIFDTQQKVLKSPLDSKEFYV